MSGKQCYRFTIIKRVNFHWRASICYKYKWCGISISVQSWMSQPTTRLWHKRLTWNCEVAIPDTGPWFNIKISSYQYKKSHCGDKTVIRSSYLHNGISYTGMMASLYWISLQFLSSIIGQITAQNMNLIHDRLACLSLSRDRQTGTQTEPLTNDDGWMYKQMALTITISILW